MFKYITLFIFFLNFSFVLGSILVPKESYLTFDQFLKEKSSASKLKSVPSNWINLTFSSPLIGKYEINDKTVLSISKFDGNIGDELSNYNRWRLQLNLSPLEQLASNQVRRSSLGSSSLREYSLENSKTNFLIYWISNNTSHYFVKVESQLKINKAIFKTFVESQSWENI